MRVDSARVRALLERARAARILVVGDVMLDHFAVGRVLRISPEAPVPIVEFQYEDHRLGGAANVANNARSLGATVDLVGVVGDDESAHGLREQLARRQMDDSDLVVAAGRPTTRKLRIVTTRNQQVARIDYESDADVSGAVEDALVARIEERAGSASVIVVSDYLKGVVTPRVMRLIAAEATSRGTPLLVDPKIPHLGLYSGATLVTPNHHEAEIATGVRIGTSDAARAAAREFRRRAGCESVLLTWGEHGMWLLRGRWTARHSAEGRGEIAIEGEWHIPAAAREVADVTGAGDTVIAAAALAIASGAGLDEAAAVANVAAGVVVSHFGPATVSPVELLAAIDAAPSP
jgi:D-beta-D-heptose 7-phosphate kinase/D-beta-D-heptose 1-phosphate adenosyltransferase